jgi:hypothetical protein
MNRRSNIRPTWNLHPDHNLSTDEGRARFLKEKLNSRIDRRDLLPADFASLSGLILFQLVMVGLILRSQDIL